MSSLIEFLIPRDEKFFDRLKAQSLNVVEASREFNSLIKDYSRLSLKEKQRRVSKIKKYEHTGDEFAHQIILELHRTFITPLDREDIHNLTLLLDDIVDISDIISRRLIQYKMKTIPPIMQKQASLALKVVLQVDDSIKKLHSTSPTSHYQKIHALEDTGDLLHSEAYTALFNSSKDAKDVLKLKDLYDLFEALIDKGQDVSVLIQGIVVKHV